MGMVPAMSAKQKGARLDHVLIVDPDEVGRARVRRLLSEADVAPLVVSEATATEEASKAYNAERDKRPSVIVMSLDLAGEHGDEWLNEIRGSSEILSTPVVLLSGDEVDDRIEVALAAGATEWLLATNLTSIGLLRTLQHVFARHQLLWRSIENEKEFHLLVDTTPVLVWVADENKARVFFNKVWLDFTGRTLAQEKGRGWLEGVHPDDRQSIWIAYSEAFDQRELFQREYRLRRFDGEYRWILARGLPRYDNAGDFLGYNGTCIDITERKLAEETLRLNEERLRVLLNGSPITAMTVDRELRYTWVHNPQAGFTVEQMVGKRDEELFPSAIAQPYIAFKREVLAKKAPIRREMEVAWQGAVEWFDTRAEPLYNERGEIVGLTMVAINITERVRNEERAQFLADASHVLASSLDYNTTLEQVANAMVPKLADWCSVDIVSNEREIVQVAVAHVDPAKVKWAKGLRAQNPPKIDDPAGLALVLRTGKSEFYPYVPQELLEEALRNAEDEEQRRIIRSVGFKSVMIVPLLTRNQILGAITFVWSDSDRHYDEADLAFAQELAGRAATAVDHARLYHETQQHAEELRQLNAKLEELVEERTQELQRSNQDLDQFAYIASHDLKAPLRAIDHLSTWVMEDVGAQLPARSREHLSKMRSRIMRMEGLLDDLLTYSRAGRFRGEAATVDLNELVARVIDTVSPPENFVMEVIGDLPTIRTYAAPLETVLRNLINNAIKHHDKPRGHIAVSAADLGDWIEFTVADDGPGIDPLFHERIFQMFQTLRPRDQVEGSGIGLAVVEKIVGSVDGTITLESAPGEGAAFHFTWPRQFAG
jgi:PAS domain S-box-containing protein